jgi:hypothetical protein
MDNVCKLYPSHRLYVYQSCLGIFHRLFVDNTESINDDLEPIEDILTRIEAIFIQYDKDSIYYHMKLVFEFLKMEYYNHYRVYKKAERYFDEVNDAASSLLTNYSLYTYPSQFLLTKVSRHNRMETEAAMYEENETLFHDFETDASDLPKYVTYITYRTLCCFYVRKYDEAARWVNNLLNEMSLKKYPQAQLEIKLLLALQYCMLNDFELFSQLLNSIQRQIRLLGKENCERAILFTKILKTAIYDSKNDKLDKLKPLIDKLNKTPEDGFSISKYIKMDQHFITSLANA